MSGLKTFVEADLPEGWRESKVGEHFAFKNGLNKSKHFFGYGTPIINYMDVYRHPWLLPSQVSGKVSVTRTERRAYSAEQHDAFFTRTSEIVAEIGMCSVLMGPIESAVFSGFVLRARPLSDLLSPGFAAYMLRGRKVREQIEASATYTTRALTNGRSLSSVNFLLPPLHEQQRITSVLRDVDELIASLDALIAKKRDIKQAAMQQLLTGKTRLPGFSREWQQSALGDVLRVRHGRDQKAIQCDDGRYPILATGGEIGRTNTPLYTRPSVLIGRKGTIDRPQFMDQPFWTVDTLFYTEIQGLNSPLYLFYVFQTIDWRSYNEASGVPSLSTKTIEAIPIKLPEPDEQVEIATNLADYDREIDGLEKRSAKFLALREGMMQQLLTGRIRLV